MENLPVPQNTVERAIDQWTKDVLRTFGAPLIPRDLTIQETDDEQTKAESFLTAALTGGSVTVVSLDGSRIKYTPSTPSLESQLLANSASGTVQGTNIPFRLNVNFGTWSEE